MSLLRRIATAAFLITASHAAMAQSNPGFAPNSILPASSLNAAFVTKLDAVGGLGSNTTLNTPTINNGNIINASINGGNLIGTLSGGTLSGTTLVNATFVGSTGTPNQTSVSCGTSSTTLLTSSAATSFISVQLPAASGPVWFNWAGGAATTAAPSQYVPAGGQQVWSTAGGFLPTSAATCIASGSAITVTLLYK